MAPTISSEQLTAGTVITPQDANIEGALQTLVSFAGIDMSRELAVIVLAACVFAFGVMVACVLKLNGKTHWSKVGVASVVMFFLSSPAWSFTLSGDWGSSPMPVLDQILAYADGAAPLSKKMFALGIVMMMGTLSWPIFNALRTILMKFVRSKDPTNPGGGTPAPS
ncbi:hypothetical protein [Parasulfitobacter algicola]|uniref:Uncharacterized protein n=1 Tax=Parasulfitobacter algicola TaxID=2614809 RepID=A0ABX2IWM8_9RHOB|nr:hypothetical protein [Sulfitobacter algicola]NSX54503.1 hypothetical protein [Sulfitobacter algicola]